MISLAGIFFYVEPNENINMIKFELKQFSPFLFRVFRRQRQDFVVVHPADRRRQANSRAS